MPYVPPHKRSGPFVGQNVEPTFQSLQPFSPGIPAPPLAAADFQPQPQKLNNNSYFEPPMQQPQNNFQTNFQPQQHHQPHQPHQQPPAPHYANGAHNFGNRGYGHQQHQNYNQGQGYGNRYNQQFGRGNDQYFGVRHHQHQRGGYGRQSRFGGYGDYQPRYQMDRTDRHSHYENRSTWGKEIFDGKDNTSAGINFDLYDTIDVTHENFDGFVPVDSFEGAGLCPSLLRNVQYCGFKKPTPIQKYTLPVIMQNRDVMACAQTGSGKTAAFLLPIINNLLAIPQEEVGFHSRSKCYPKALILSPTRELAQQIHKDCVKFLYQTGLGSACIFGGSKVQKQIEFLQRNRVDILIATAGRLWDMYERGRLSFEDVHYFILDEADNMLDMGFERQINMILYDSDLSNNRLNLLFSATMPPEIQQLASNFLNNYVFLSFGMVNASSILVTQKFELVQEEDKIQRLCELMEEIQGRVLVFVAMKRTADSLEWTLERELGKRGCIAIHGDKSQRDRERALSGFRRGKYRVLIATDVAARGLDIRDISHVIQYDMPGNVDSYVHRVGRTGRCGNKGIAIAFVNAGSKNVLGPLIKQLQKENNTELPDWLLEMNRKYNHRRGGYNRYRRGRGGGNRRGRGGRHWHNRQKRGNNFQNNRNRW